MGKKSPPNEKKKNIPCLITFLFYFSTYCLATALNSQLFSYSVHFFFFFFLSRYLETLAEPKRYYTVNVIIKRKEQQVDGRKKYKARTPWQRKRFQQPPLNELAATLRVAVRGGKKIDKTLSYSYIYYTLNRFRFPLCFSASSFTSGSFFFFSFSFLDF